MLETRSPGDDREHSLHDLLGADALARFDASGPIMTGLPATAYTSEAFFALENRRLFSQRWVFAGFAHDLPNPGDAMPVSVAGRPVLLLRDGAGAVRAFHNVCRHRCLKLVDRPGNVGRVVRCPYHAWTYALDGSLMLTPHFGGCEPREVPDGFDRSSRGLVPVRVSLWHHWIFVDLGGSAPPLDALLEPLQRWLQDIDLASVEHLITLDLGEVQANWKLLVENFVEPYHVQFVHSSTTEQPLTDHYTVNEPGCLGSAVDVRRGEGESAREDTLAVSSRYLTVFPNFVFGRYLPDQIGVHLNVPLSAGRTFQRRAIYATGGARKSPAEIERLARLWRAVHEEDHAICERLQAGRASRVAEDGGVLSPVWEDSVASFQRLVVDALR